MNKIKLNLKLSGLYSSSGADHEIVRLYFQKEFLRSI